VVPNWVLNTHYQAFFWRRCQGERRFLQQEPRMLNLFLCFCFALFYFCLHRFIKNTKKISSLVVVTFTYLLFSLARMSNPEVEVCTFKQQGGESLKDSWYQISNAHHRCTKKHSTMILLRNFLCWYI
jgi:hypothetical protein